MEKSEEMITLTMNDVRKLNHNLGSDVLYQYDFTESSELTVGELCLTSSWQGKKVEGFELYRSFTEDNIEHLGYAIKIDDEIKHLIAIDDWIDCICNAERGLIAVFGNDEIIHLWLDNGQFDSYVL